MLRLIERLTHVSGRSCSFAFSGRIARSAACRKGSAARRRAARAAMFGALALVSGTGGCSMDGGFFPGTITHDEGAVDYRVAEMIDVPANGAGGGGGGGAVAVPAVYTDPRGEVSNHAGYLPLGGPKNQPYIPFSEQIQIGSFPRVKKPNEIVRGEEALAAARNTIEDFSKLVVSRTQVLLDRQGVQRIKVAAAEDADRKLASVKAVLNDKVSDRNQLTTELEDKNKIPKTDPGYQAIQARIKELPGLIGEANQAVQTAEEAVKTNETASNVAQGLLASAKDAVESANAELDAANKGLKTSQERAKECEDNLAKLVKAWESGSDQEVVTERVKSVRVTLKQSYLREFSENGPVGEVAVLMTVKESRNGLGQQEPKAGRVVYYSEGVRQNAFMNFRDQPVYGPIRYSGDDLQIRISIIELDENDNAVAGAMLKTIASIGSIAYPPSSPVLAALDQIGASLLTLNGPDLEWDYLMRLSAHPPEDVAGTKFSKMYDAWLRDGYFVLLRSDVSADPSTRQRVSQAEWSKLYLDPQSGTLYERTDFSESSVALQTNLEAAQQDYRRACDAYRVAVGLPDRPAASVTSRLAQGAGAEIPGAIVVTTVAPASTPAAAAPAPGAVAASGTPADPKVAAREERARQEQIDQSRKEMDKALTSLNAAAAKVNAYSPFKLYTAHSYLVFSVQTGFDSSQLDLAQETAELSSVVEAYSSGSDRLGNATEVLAKSLQASIEQLRKRKDEAGQNKKEE